MDNLLDNTLKQRLANTVSPLIGQTIKQEHIYTDEEGWHYYIPSKGLQKRHPLILNHYRGYLFMVIPTDDWKELESGTVSAINYIKYSHWNYGYYWGGGSMLFGVYWQPFEEKGIHDTLRIATYLEMLRCRTNYHSSRYLPTEEQCKDCWVEKCPFNQIDKKLNFSRFNEVYQERDFRKELFFLVKEKIQQQSGFKATACFTHGNNGGVWLLPNYEDNTVTVYLPRRLLIGLLYHPEKYDINAIVDSWDISVEDPRAPKKKPGFFARLFGRY